MQLSHSEHSGTCVVGEIAGPAAFASVAYEGVVWAKKYPRITDAVSETRKMGLVDKLFATAAPRYIEANRTPCISPLYSRVNARKLEAAGFRRTDANARFE